MDREKVVSHLQIIHTWATVDLRSPKEPIWSYRTLEDVKQWTDDAIALLKEQEEQKRKWLQTIADTQLANAPKDRKEFMSLDEHMEYQYQLGVYDGLQMAWDILTEDDNAR